MKFKQYLQVDVDGITSDPSSNKPMSNENGRKEGYWVRPSIHPLPIAAPRRGILISELRMASAVRSGKRTVTGTTRFLTNIRNKLASVTLSA